MKTPANASPGSFSEVVCAAPPPQEFLLEGFPFQKQADMRFLKCRIVKQREEHIRREMMQERRKLFASGDERAFAE